MTRLHRLLPLFLLAVTAAPAPAQAPRISVSAPGWDFGIRTHGETDETVIQIRNDGDRVLEIRNIEVTCGCIVPEMKQKSIPAGGAADLVLRLDSARATGEVRKQVFIDSNDPAQRRLSLDISGHVRPVIWTSYREVMLGEMSNGRAHTKWFKVCVAAGYDVKLVGLEAHPIEMTADAEPFREPNGVSGWHVKLSFPKGLEATSFEGAVFVKTDFAPLPVMGVRVIAEFVGSVVASTETLAFGSLKAGEARTIPVRFTKEVGDGIALADTYSENDRISFGAVVEITSLKVLEVPITLTARPGDGNLFGTAFVTIDQPGQRTFEFKWSARVVP